MSVLNGQLVGPANAPPVGGGSANEVPISNGAPGSGQFGDAQVPSPANMDANPYGPLVSNIVQTVKGMADTATQVWNPVTGVDPSKIGGQVLGAAKQVNTLMQGGVTAEPPIPATAAPLPIQPGSHAAHVDAALSSFAQAKAGGGVGGPPGMKYEKVDPSGQANAAEEGRKAIEERTKAELDVLKSQDTLRNEQMKSDLAHAEKLQHIANEADAALDARVKAKEATKQAILNEATTVDPDRWMRSRTPLQMAAMVIANGLTHGRAWAQFQTSIDNDVKAQQQSFENRRTQLKDADAVDDSIYGMYRQQGLDRRDAALATHDTMNAIFKQRFEAIALTSNSDFVKANAHAAIAASQGIEAKNQAAEVNAQNEFKLKQQQLAAQTWEAQKKMELEREKFTLAAQAKGEKLEGLKPQMMEEAVRDKQLETDVKALNEKFKGASGFFNKLAVLVPDAWTDAGEYNIMRQQLMQKFVRSSQHDAPSQKEFDYYESMLPKAGDQGGMKKFEELIKRIESDREARISTYKAGKYDTAGLEADLAKDRKSIDFRKK